MGVEADPTELGELGQACVTAGTDLRKKLGTTRDEALIPAAAFGNSPGAEGIQELYSNVLEAAGQAFEDLAGISEKDADLIYGAAFAYQATDGDNANLLDQYRPVPEPEPGPSPDPTPSGE